MTPADGVAEASAGKRLQVGYSSHQAGFVSKEDGNSEKRNNGSSCTTGTVFWS